MESNSIVLWRNTDLPVLPKKVNNISELVNYGLQLSTKDQNQIIKTFEDGSYEMVATYIWTRAINSLKTQLGKMGVSFIAELLERPDVDEHTNIQQVISEFEAIKLAEELGIISGTAAFRLRHAMETVTHFNQLEPDDPDNELSEEETKLIIRSCIEGSLRYSKIDATIDFKNFRKDLEEITLQEDSPYIIKLTQSPYFFHRTTLRILLSIVKSSSGAPLENSLANSNLIIPKLWPTLKHPERYQVGRSYAELFADGKSKSASGLKQVLLKVKGFDFVPEDLRSSSFIKVANEILVAHEGMNNFYNEPAPINTLCKMGTVIPIPAFSICMTAILSVRLGNRYGVSIAAQDNALHLLRNVTQDRWLYFFNECLQTNDRILYKLTLDGPSERWINLFKPEFIEIILPDINEKNISNLLKFTRDKNQEKLRRLAMSMYTELGYTNK